MQVAGPQDVRGLTSVATMGGPALAEYELLYE